MENSGATVMASPLTHDHCWRPDLKALNTAIAPGTRLNAGNCLAGHEGNVQNNALELMSMSCITAIMLRVGA